MNTVVKLLVIDDDEADKLHLKRALKACGFRYELTECEDARDVTNTVLEKEFDCIFLDYVLPGDNGLSLLKKIREHGVKTPIVIVTSQGNESIAVELMKAGASDYIIKNEINEKLLSQVVRNMLRMSEMVKEGEPAHLMHRAPESLLAKFLEHEAFYCAHCELHRA